MTPDRPSKARAVRRSAISGSFTRAKPGYREPTDQRPSVPVLVRITLEQTNRLADVEAYFAGLSFLTNLGREGSTPRRSDGFADVRGLSALTEFREDNDAVTLSSFHMASPVEIGLLVSGSVGSLIMLLTYCRDFHASRRKGLASATLAEAGAAEAKARADAQAAYLRQVTAMIESSGATPQSAEILAVAANALLALPVTGLAYGPQPALESVDD